MKDELKIGQIVILKDQSHNLRNGTLIGGVIKAMGDEYIILYKHMVGFQTIKRDAVRIVNPDDIGKERIEII